MVEECDGNPPHCCGAASLPHGLVQLLLQGGRRRGGAVLHGDRVQRKKSWPWHFETRSETVEMEHYSVCYHLLLFQRLDARAAHNQCTKSLCSPSVCLSPQSPIFFPSTPLPSFTLPPSYSTLQCMLPPGTPPCLVLEIFPSDHDEEANCTGTTGNFTSASGQAPGMLASRPMPSCCRRGCPLATTPRPMKFFKNFKNFPWMFRARISQAQDLCRFRIFLGIAQPCAGQAGVSHHSFTALR